MSLTSCQSTYCLLWSTCPLTCLLTPCLSTYCPLNSCWSMCCPINFLSVDVLSVAFQSVDMVSVEFLSVDLSVASMSVDVLSDEFLLVDIVSTKPPTGRRDVRWICRSTCCLLNTCRSTCPLNSCRSTRLFTFCLSKYLSVDFSSVYLVDSRWLVLGSSLFCTPIFFLHLLKIEIGNLLASDTKTLSTAANCWGWVVGMDSPYRRVTSQQQWSIPMMRCTLLSKYKSMGQRKN